MRGIEHHSQLFRAKRILARHDRARVRPVRNSARMQCDRTALDAAPRTEISADVKQNLIRFDVIMHPRNLDRFRMRIEEARRERADDVTANFKGLMDRRRLMHRAGNRFEILRVESERIEIAIPADRIERMLRQRHARETRAVFNQNIDVFLFVDGDDLRRSMQITLRNRARPS